MSGPNQHFIPRMFLRGFGVQTDRGKPTKIWKYTHDGAELQDISNVGADEYFYSHPDDPEEARSLDDRITRYESARLRKLLGQLTSARVSDAIDPMLAAEVVAHLAPRSSHLREIMGLGMGALINMVGQILSDVDLAKTFVGLSGRHPSDQFRQLAQQQIEQLRSLSGTSIPFGILERMSFVLAKENFGEIHRDFSDNFPGAIESLQATSSPIIREKHNELLNESLVLKRRMEPLAKLYWSVVKRSSDKFVLPDCIAIVIDKDDKISSFMTSNSENINLVIMPITSDRILLGSRKDNTDNIDHPINEYFAKCSEKFFLSSEPGERFERLVTHVGKLAGHTIDGAIRKSIKSLIKSSSSGTEEKPFSMTIDQPKSDREYDSDFSYQISFEGAFDAKEIENIVIYVSDLVRNINALVPMRRLDGVTFTFDYPATLASLDRGISTTKVLTTFNDNFGVGVAQAPIVMRDGQPKNRVIIRAEFGLALLSNDVRDVSAASQLLMSQFAETALTELMEMRFPGALMKPFEREIDGFLYERIAAAIGSYFSSRMSSGFDGSDFALAEQSKLFKLALEDMATEIPRLRWEYRHNGDLDAFLIPSMDKIEHVLSFAGRVVGYSDGLSTKPLTEEIHATLREYGLANWFITFADDLRELWKRQLIWSSFTEFLDVAQHVERLCWQFGIIPFGRDGGGVAIDVPLGTDADALARWLENNPPSRIE
jgi:hypothetical protein